MIEISRLIGDVSCSSKVAFKIRMSKMARKSGILGLHCTIIAHQTMGLQEITGDHTTPPSTSPN